MDAWNRTDVDALGRAARPRRPRLDAAEPVWYAGRDEIRTFLDQLTRSAPAGPQHIHIPTRANRQPAFAVYLGDRARRPSPFGIEVLRIADGLIAEIDFFLQPGLVERFAVATPA